MDFFIDMVIVFFVVSLSHLFAVGPLVYYVFDEIFKLTEIQLNQCICLEKTKVLMATFSRRDYI